MRNGALEAGKNTVCESAESLFLFIEKLKFRTQPQEMMWRKPKDLQQIRRDVRITREAPRPASRSHDCKFDSWAYCGYDD
jgi:hypothetical protein